MDWTGRARAALAGRIDDEDVVAELADHAAAVYAQARAEGASVEEATRLAEEQLAIGPDACLPVHGAAHAGRMWATRLRAAKKLSHTLRCRASCLRPCRVIR